MHRYTTLVLILLTAFGWLLPTNARAKLGDRPVIASYSNPLLVSDSDAANASDWDAHDASAMINAMLATGQNTYFSEVRYHPDIQSGEKQAWDEYLALLDAIATEGAPLEVVAVFKKDQGLDAYLETACRMRSVAHDYPDVAVAWMIDDFQSDLCLGASLRGSCLGPDEVEQIRHISNGGDDSLCEELDIGPLSGVDFVAYISSNALLDVGVDSMLLGGLSCYERDGDTSDTWGQNCEGLEDQYEFKPIDEDYAAITYTVETQDQRNGLHLSFLHSDTQTYAWSDTYNTCKRDLILAVEVDGTKAWQDFFLDGRDAGEEGTDERIELAEIDLSSYIGSPAADLEVRFVVRNPDGGPADYQDCLDDDGNDVTSWSKATAQWAKLAFLAGVSFTDDDGAEIGTDTPLSETSGHSGLIADVTNADWRIDAVVNALVIVLDQDPERQSSEESTAILDLAADEVESSTLVLPLMRGYFNGDHGLDTDHWYGAYHYALSNTDGMITYRMPLEQYQQPWLEGLFTEREPISTDSSNNPLYDYILHRPEYVGSMIGWGWHQTYTFTVPSDGGDCEGHWELSTKHDGGTGNTSHGQTWTVTTPDGSTTTTIAKTSSSSTRTIELIEGAEVEISLAVDEGRGSEPILEFSWTPPASCGLAIPSTFSSGFNDTAVELYELITGIYLDFS